MYKNKVHYEPVVPYYDTLSFNTENVEMLFEERNKKKSNCKPICIDISSEDIEVVNHDHRTSHRNGRTHKPNSKYMFNFY